MWRGTHSCWHTCRPSIVHLDKLCNRKPCESSDLIHDVSRYRPESRQQIERGLLQSAASNCFYLERSSPLMLCFDPLYGDATLHDGRDQPEHDRGGYLLKERTTCWSLSEALMREELKAFPTCTNFPLEQRKAAPRRQPCCIQCNKHVAKLRN